MHHHYTDSDDAVKGHYAETDRRLDATICGMGCLSAVVWSALAAIAYATAGPLGAIGMAILWGLCAIAKHVEALREEVAEARQEVRDATPEGRSEEASRRVAIEDAWRGALSPKQSTSNARQTTTVIRAVECEGCGVKNRGDQVICRACHEPLVSD